MQPVLAMLRKAGPAQIRLSGLTATAKALYTVLLHKATDRPIVLLVETNAQADEIAETMGGFFELLEASKHRRPPLVLPGHDVTPYDGLSPHADISEKRGIGLCAMASGEASIVVAPIHSALLKVAGADSLRNLAWNLQTGDEFFLEDLEQGLLSVGYERHEPVEMVGQFSIRGGIIDVYSPEAPNPLRIEMFGDQIESLRVFDPETQKSIQTVDQATLLPLTEYPVGPKGLPANAEEQSGQPVIEITPPGWEFFSQAAALRNSSLVELLEQPILVWSEPAALASVVEKHEERLRAAREGAGGAPEPGVFYFSLGELQQAVAGGQQLFLEELGIEGEIETLHISSRNPLHFQGNIGHFVRELQSQITSGHRALITAPSLGEVERLAEVFSEFEIPYQLALRDPAKASSPYLQEKAYLAGPVSGVVLVEAPLRNGVVLPDSRIILYGYEDLFATSELVARPKKPKSVASAFLSGLQDLKEGDRVVHSEHGVGRYLGIKQVNHAGRHEDFMLLEYADQAKLYVPLASLDLVQKYNGAGGPLPPLDRMGGQTWSRTKAKVKARLLDMADELLKLYAARKAAPGFAFSPDSNWQREFEEAFEYTETPDQLKSIADIKRDLESSQPMDRLVCGDVGFGKTEVAMRAAFKALADEKQVAILAPTTVLAFQHYETFRQRFAAFPVEIEMLTRFRTRPQQAEILERLAAGKVDILIGTHRLLSRDVVFADLGLLVVDEEQRFGVRHKERLKQITKGVDVLTLTATPIPRTLHMSLVGLRDISVIQTPPRDRLAIQTVVAPRNDQIIRTAVEQEIGRGGQVYFIHNRIESIWSVAAHIQQLVPGARLGVGHGQMTDADLEKVVLRFMRHEFDVFVSTTIVENGLDIPLANTIIMDRAENYGLSELYQLRGRVGRSNRRAYAYLLVAEDTELSSTARKRLAALKEFSELGSGFKIAALDLELRGAGNLLGAEQHGHIASVGFETYCRLLEDTMRKLQGEDVEDPVRASLKLQLDVHIPPDYIADEMQRLQVYKRLAEIQNEPDAERISSELQDRYGPPPPAVRNLIDYALLKSRAERMRIESIERRRHQWTLRFRSDSKVDASQLMKFVAATRGASFSPQGVLQCELNGQEAPLSTLKQLLHRLAPAVS